MTLNQEEAPWALERSGGQKEIQGPLYTPRQPKLQLAKNTRDVFQVGAIRRPLGESTLELAVLNRNGRSRFRLTEIQAGGHRRRFSLRLSDIQTVISSLHKAKSIMETAK